MGRTARQVSRKPLPSQQVERLGIGGWHGRTHSYGIRKVALTAWLSPSNGLDGVAASEDLAGDRTAVDFRGSVTDAHAAHVAVVSFVRILFR